MSGMTVEKVGRRFYAKGAPFEMKNKLKDLGCTWDGDVRAWWTGKASVAEAIKALGEKIQAGLTNDPVSLDANVINGRAEYKGRVYYILFHGPKRDGSGMCAKLAARDGSMVFWASSMAEFKVLKLYRSATSINALRAFAERAKTHGTAACACACHREANAGAPGTTLYDGCDRCGCEAC